MREELSLQEGWEGAASGWRPGGGADAAFTSPAGLGQSLGRGEVL